MRKAEFNLESLAGERFSGYTNGEEWNGWAYPYFTFEESERIVQAHNNLADIRAGYDETNDVFSFEFYDEVEQYKGILLKGQKLYPIGAGSWIWEQIK